MTTDLEDDFADLEAIIAEDEDRRALKRRAAAKQLSPEEQAQFDVTFIWRVTANIALFHSQQCLSCGSHHRFFMGWYTEQQHRSDPHARRFVAGKHHEPLPERVEVHSQGLSEMCSDCAESCLIINQFVKD